MRLVSTTPPSSAFLTPASTIDSRLKNSDFAFTGNLLFQGNYSGWQAWDISDPRNLRLRQAYVCPGSQNDVSVYKNLLFVSGESPSGRTDCGLQGFTSADTVSPLRARGIRILDISNIARPRYVTTVQTCRGSHTNTLVTDPNDKDNVYIYVSGSSGVRDPRELPGCSGLPPEQDPNTALFRIEVIQVPLRNPAAAKIVSSPRIFTDLAPAPRNAARDAAGRAGGAAGRGGADPDDSTQVGRGGAGGRRGGGAGGAGGRAGGANPPAVRRGPNQCHDITVYPAVGLAGGACGGYGLLLDIRDVKNPKRITFAADSNMSFWHSATFSNDGSKVLFSDEWGGGSGARCRVTDRPEWGSDAIFTIEGNELKFQSYFKLPAAQSNFENCVAHNGSLIPVPGRDIMVQSWYQGGINVFDWTDPKNPKEIAFFDRGPIDSTRLIAAGHWSAYWYNGYIYGSEEFRGVDVLELTPSPFLTQNEIDAAKTVRQEWFNPQEQPKLVWPASFVVARAYIDQLARSNGIARDRLQQIAGALSAAEQARGSSRRTTLNELAMQLESEAGRSADAAKVRLLLGVVRDLAR
jgi:hypothetical protein